VQEALAIGSIEKADNKFVLIEKFKLNEGVDPEDAKDTL